MKSPISSRILGITAACFCIESAPGQTYNWTGAVNSDYTNGANWVEGSWSEWKNYVFGSSATTGSVNINAVQGTGSLSLTSGLNHDITMSGQPLIMALGHGTPVASITIDSNSKNLTVNSEYWSQSPVTWNIGEGRTFTLNGPLKNWLATTGIVKQGSGTAVLAGANNFSGTTDITAGTLVAANNTALGVGGHNGGTMTFIRDGATLALQGGVSLDEHFHVWGAGVGGLGAVRSISGNNSLTNAPGGAAGYAIRSNTTIGVDADTLTVPGFYQDGGTFGITKVGAGTLKLSVGSSYGGITEISAGTLVAANGTALGTGGLSATTLTNIRDGGTLALQGGVSLDEHFHAWGHGVGGLGTVRSLSGNNALTLVDGSGNGGLAIDTDITVGVDADKLTASGFYHDSGSFGITKVGDGTLELSAKSRYTGATNVNAGNLIINGNISTSSLTTVKSGASLSGSGTVGALTVLNGGTLAPGNSPGTLTVGGTLSLENLSVLSFELNPADTTVGGGINDLITGVTGLTLDGLLNVTATTGSFAGVTSGTWRLFNYSGSLTNNALTLNTMPALDSGYSWFVDTSTTNQVNLTIVPEPAAVLLGGLGMLALLRRRR